MSRKTIAKRTIAERIADQLELGQTQSLQVIQTFLDEIINELAEGNRLEFRDFGVFETVERKPRMALNPKTLEKVPVDRKVVVKFKVGRLMKERVAALGKVAMDDFMDPAPASDLSVSPPLPGDDAPSFGSL